MRLVTFCTADKPAPRVGARVDARMLDVAAAASAAPLVAKISADMNRVLADQAKWSRLRKEAGIALQ